MTTTGNTPTSDTVQAAEKARVEIRHDLETLLWAYTEACAAEISMTPEEGATTSSFLTWLEDEFENHKFENHIVQSDGLVHQEWINEVVHAWDNAGMA